MYRPDAQVRGEAARGQVDRSHGRVNTLYLFVTLIVVFVIINCYLKSSKYTTDWRSRVGNEQLRETVHTQSKEGRKSEKRKWLPEEQ